MRSAVRLTRRSEGGFRMEGVATTPLDGVPDDAGFVLTGAEPLRLTWSATDRGWILTGAAEQTAGDEIGRTMAPSAAPVLAPVSVLLADGRLFRLAVIGASDPRVELGRWDVPGAFVVGHPDSGGWELERTVAGSALDAPRGLWILVCAEIGRLDGWY